MKSTAYTVGDLPSVLAFISACAAERWPVPSPIMTSDVAWQLPGSEPESNMRLW
jgi:hypothetical protein